jgi:hypothetical protein
LVKEVPKTKIWMEAIIWTVAIKKALRVVLRTLTVK